MLRTFKMNVWLLFLLLLLSQNALADKAVIFPASQSVLSQERIGSIIADFFAEKCELSHEYVESALRENTLDSACWDMDIFLMLKTHPYGKHIFSFMEEITIYF